MKINKLTIYYSQTVQMRQFEPLVISASAEAQIDEGDDAKREFRKIYETIKKEVDEKVLEKKIERKKSFDEKNELEKNA